MKFLHFKHDWKWKPITPPGRLFSEPKFFFVGQKKIRQLNGTIKIKYATARIERCSKCGRERGMIDYGDSVEIVSAFHLSTLVQTNHFRVVRHNPIFLQTETPPDAQTNLPPAEE